MNVRVLAVVLLSCVAAFPQASGNKIDAVNISPAEEQKFEAMIAPCIAMTKKALPDVKKNYVGRQLQGDALYVTVRLYDPNGKKEALHLQVATWEGAAIRGKINETPRALKTYHRGQTIEVKETDVLDWTFLKPDGTEDGNLIGRQIESPNHDVCK